MLCTRYLHFSKKFSLRWYSVFCINVFSISDCHGLKSVIYKKVSVCICVYVCACVCVCECVMQDVSKTKNLLSLERVAGGHQKATESEIRTHIGNTLKI